MMLSTRSKTIVVLGLMAKMPFAGVVWQTLHYLIGLERLGFKVYYVEAHGITPTKLMTHAADDGPARAADFIADVMARFDLPDRWTFHAPHDGNRYLGMSRARLEQVYADADLIINLHGGTLPLPEQSATGRLVYLETDPVEVQVQLNDQRADTIAYLEPHVAFFTFGENYGRPGCGLPVSDRFRFRPTRQPVVMDFWRSAPAPERAMFTTIANWRQPGEVRLRGETFHWSKDLEFRKFLDVPARTSDTFELALSSASHTDADARLLADHGWRVRDALEVSGDADTYRGYIQQSRGEFTVAKDQNVRLRTGWFSDRSATYLASGRPVITQETGFSDILPTGEGLMAFETLDDIVTAVDRLKTDYVRHARAATDCASECFAHDVVLSRLLADIGLSASGGAGERPVSADGTPASTAPAYEQAIERTRTIVSRDVPAGATILVVSNGDDALLRFDGRRALHFPGTDDGVYCGYHPADSAAAIQWLETERARGADFLVVPASALWWLDFYAGFRQHLDANYRLLIRDEGSCALFDVRPSADGLQAPLAP